MGITITKPPVQVSGVSMEDAQAIAQAIADLGPGEFVTTGDTFPSKIEKKKNKAGKEVSLDTGRAQANALASKFIRVIESRFDVNLRSRTWQNEKGEWTFGIRPKDSAEGDAPAEEESEG